SSVENVRETSAMPRAGRFSDPLKMTSSIERPRRLLALISPMTQRMASTTLDLPQPFGPTTPQIGASKSIMVGSTKDLKPSSSRRLILNQGLLQRNVKKLNNFRGL